MELTLKLELIYIYWFVFDKLNVKLNKFISNITFV